MYDEACQVMEDGGSQRRLLRPLENIAQAQKGLLDSIVDVEIFELKRDSAEFRRTQLPFRNRGYAISGSRIILSLELRVAHDEHRDPGGRIRSVCGPV